MSYIPKFYLIIHVRVIEWKWKTPVETFGEKNTQLELKFGYVPCHLGELELEHSRNVFKL